MSSYYEWLALEQGRPSLIGPQVERPFGDKGIVLNIPPQLLVDGTVLDAKNLLATQRGLKRRPGTAPFTSANVIPDPPIQDAIGFWKVTGTQDLLVLGKSYLYKASSSTGYTVIPDQWEIGGKITVAGTAVTGGNTKFLAAGVQAGDSIIIDPTGTPVTRVIQSINSEVSITLTVSGGTYASYTAFKISRPFRAANPWFVDWTVLTGGTPRVLFADGVYPLRGYDGTTLEDYGLINNGTVSTTYYSYIVTGVGTSFVLSGVLPGDLIVLDFDGTEGGGIGSDTRVIQSVDSDTQLTLTEQYSSHTAGTDYRIIQIGRPKAHCVAYHKDRVWEANTIESGNQYRQRIRWTYTGDLDNFVLGGWLDLPYVQGSIKKLLPMGDFLVAYFDDAVFIGRPASFGTNLSPSNR
jgi:hypothetical protein